MTLVFFPNFDDAFLIFSGPINWFLSLRMWKLPARISFAMYIFHYPLMHVVNASAVAPGYFTVAFYVSLLLVLHFFNSACRMIGKLLFIDYDFLGVN